MPVLKYKNPADGTYIPLGPIEEVTVSESPPPVNTDLWVDLKDNSGGLQDSGWRGLASLLVNGWTYRPSYIGVAIRRIGDTVHLTLNGLDPPGTSAVTAMNPISGFWPKTSTGVVVHFPLIGQSPWTVQTTISGMVDSLGLRVSGSAQPAKGTYLSAFTTYPTDDPWPLTLPGVAL